MAFQETQAEFQEPPKLVLQATPKAVFQEPPKVALQERPPKVALQEPGESILAPA